MPRATRITIDPSALLQNLQRVRALAPASRVWAVVKADAYGHGLDGLLPSLSQADGLALVEFDRAWQLRQRGWAKPVMMLEGAFDLADTRLAADLSLDLTVHEPRQVEWLKQLDSNSRIAVHLKLNSGMNRLGFTAEDYPRVFSEIRALPQVKSITLMTHFANADVAGGATGALALFERTTQHLDGERSLCNSAAIFDLPEAHRDWVRPGIMLYGASPFSDRGAQALGLRPVMAFESRVIAIQHLKPGATVGYGSTFVADRAMTVGIVACGYADGYPRHAPTGTPIAVNGVRTRTIGRVSMDMLAVDLEPVTHAQVGSAVELWGGLVPVDEVAASAGTIGYELTCAIAPRVERRMVDDGTH